ncbi:unnamed protein product, partial [Ixodes hexagonus]
ILGTKSLPRPSVRPSLRGEASWLTCSTPAVPRMLYNVSWYKHPSRYKRVLLKDLRELDDPTDDLLVSSIILGTEVSCKITGYFQDFRGHSRYKSSSKRYFVGIKASAARQNPITLVRGGGAVTVKFVTTIPLACGTSFPGNCHLRLILYQSLDKLNNLSRVGLSKCDVVLKHRGCTRRCTVAHVNLSALVNDTDGHGLHAVIEGFVESRSGPLWDGYRIPPLKVNIVSLPTQRCYSFSGVHYTSFADVKFEGRANGTFLLFKDKRKNTQVQVQTQRCYQSEVQVCTCGLVVQHDNSVVKIDMCHSAHNLPTVVAFDMEGNKPTINILRQQDGRFLIIKLSSGTFIQVILEKWGMSLLLTVPAVNTSDVAGICQFAEEGRRDMDAFVSLYRLPDEKNLFKRLPERVSAKYYEVFCTCTRLKKGSEGRRKQDNTIRKGVERLCTAINHALPKFLSNSTDVTLKYHFSQSLFLDESEEEPYSMRTDLNNSLPSKVGSEKEWYSGLEKHRGQRTPRGDIPAGLVWIKDTGYDMHSGELSWPTPSGLTEEHVRQLCEDTIKNVTTSDTCLDYIELHRKELSQICVADVTLLDDPQWASHTFSLIEMRCEEEVSLGMDPNLVLADPFQVMQNLGCPNDCSYHGVCNGRECFCDDGYTGHDCSEQDGTTPEAIATDGLCDTMSSSCDAATVYGKNFFNLPTLVCEVSQVEMNGSGAWNPAQRNFTMPARFLGSTSVDCRLPDRSFLAESGIAGHTTWEIKVSNDKARFSDSVRITVFDSSCELCSVVDDRPNCTLQELRCLIDGECYVESDTHPSDFCLSCVADRSTRHWSPNPANRAPELVGLPPELTVFSGQPFHLDLVAADPDGTQPFFRLAMAPPNVSLSHDGRLSGSIFATNNSSRLKIDVVVFDECDRETDIRIKVILLLCPCLNGGTCETWSSAEATVYDAVYCTCLRDFTGRKCEVSLNPCYSNPCFNGRCIAHGGNTFECACPEGTTGKLFSFHLGD